MPVAALRLCAGGCGARVQRDRCANCKRRLAQTRRQSESWRKAPGAHGTLIDVYQTPRWKALRLEVLEAAHYLCQCEDCATLPCPLPANTCDHRIPHRGDPFLMWDKSNLQALSEECHNRKTGREGGRTWKGSRRWLE